ncbi:MAG: hypothetical protein LM561_01600 [Desulfurococcaceae archaeon]|jgi:hypothetical protein|nr:hypothetical protein [Desulfurococcaceae archaeon]
MSRDLRVVVVGFLIIVVSLSLLPFVVRAVFGTYNPYYTFRDSILAGLLVLVWVGVITLLIATVRIYKYRSVEDAALKKIMDGLAGIQERLKALEGKELRETTQERLGKIFIELDKALRESAVILKCPQHPDAEVTILSDGSLWCKAGHYVWLSEDLKQILSEALRPKT